jgi:hypothetical protein
MNNELLVINSAAVPGRTFNEYQHSSKPRAVRRNQTMTSRSIQKMIATETLVLTKVQLLWHYCIIGFFLIPPIMNMIHLFQYYMTHTYQGVKTVGEMATWSYLPLVPAVGFYYIQKRRLKFKTINVALDNDTFIETAKVTAKQLEWKIVEKTQNLIVARSGFSWKSWGELITIIRVKDKILFNSICDPDNMTSVASWGMNKLNLKTFEQNIQLKTPNIGIANSGA